MARVNTGMETEFSLIIRGLSGRQQRLLSHEDPVRTLRKTFRKLEGRHAGAVCLKRSAFRWQFWRQQQQATAAGSAVAIDRAGAAKAKLFGRGNTMVFRMYQFGRVSVP